MRILYIIPAGFFLMLAFLCECIGWLLRVAVRAMKRCEEWTLGVAGECFARSGI